MSEIQNAEELQRALAKPSVEKVGQVPILVTPPGFNYEPMAHLLELEFPRHIKATINANEIGGLISYVNKHKTPQTSLYCGSRSTPKIEARIDDHGAYDAVTAEDSPSHVLHKCVYGCPHTIEWHNWTQGNNRRQGQVDFAEFIENNIKDVTKPNGADLLTATLKFQDTGRVEFKSHIRTNDGRVQFIYSEKDEGGELKFPERIEIAIPVFEGMTYRYPMTARVRYRIKDAELSIWYELERPDLVVKQAYSDLLEHVEKETEIQIHRAL